MHFICLPVTFGMGLEVGSARGLSLMPLPLVDGPDTAMLHSCPHLLILGQRSATIQWLCLCAHQSRCDSHF